MNTFKHSPKLNQSGQGLTEYLILMVLVAVVCITSTRQVGTAVKRKMELIKRHIVEVQIEE